MTIEADFDRSLRRWLADGDDQAPARYVESALAEVRVTAQRRPTILGLPLRSSGRPASRSLAAGIVVGMLLLAALVIFVSGSRVDPSPSPSPSATAPVASDTVNADLRRVSYSEQAVSLAIPSAWREIGAPCCELLRFGGSEPEGFLSVSHDSPFRATVCSLSCQDIVLPEFLPYSASAEMDALAERLGGSIPGATWIELPTGTIPDLDEGRRLDGVVRDGSGVEWHQTYVIGTHLRRVVAIAWRERADTSQPDLFEQVLASITVSAGAEYRSGVLEYSFERTSGFILGVPDVWLPSDQPLLGDGPASGVRRFGDGMIVVSVGDQDGSIRLCDPACRAITTAGTLDDLERVIREAGATKSASAATLDHETARSTETDARRWVFAIHAGRPVVLSFDLTTETVDPAIFDVIVGAFYFDEPIVETRAYRSPDETIEMSLVGEWRRIDAGKDAVMHLTMGRQHIWVLRGDAKGRFRPCLASAGAWEDCSGKRATTLDELVAAVAPSNASVNSVSLGGEPSVATVVNAYEGPARGRESVASIVAMHDGLPIVVRVWTTNDAGIGRLDDIIAGFRFLD